MSEAKITEYIPKSRKERLAELNVDYRNEVERIRDRVKGIYKRRMASTKIELDDYLKSELERIKACYEHERLKIKRQNK